MKTLYRARATSGFARGITVDEMTRSLYRVQRERDRERDLQATRELLALADQDFDFEARSRVATKCPNGKAYGCYDLQRKKARALPMMEWAR